MTGAARHRVADLLGAETEPEVFSASRTAPGGDLRLEVRGVGPIELPVSEAQARPLCQVGRPARYGRGELTLLDRAVRDTWEIWLASLPRLTAACQKTGEAGTAAARILLHDAWRRVSTSIDAVLEQPSPSRRTRSLSELTGLVAALVESLSQIGAADLLHQVVASLCRDDEHLVDLAVGILRATPAAVWSAAGLDRVAAHCPAALTSRLARPARAPGNWSMQLPAGCRCDLCVELGAFLADPAATSIDWPLAQDRRAHLHHRIATAELPATHQTRRRGRPYTLVLTKTDALFELDRQARARNQADLGWLQRRQG